MTAPWTPPDRGSADAATEVSICALCRHFEAGRTPYTSGECHRRAPVAQATGLALFPKVAATKWCGEGEPE